MQSGCEDTLKERYAIKFCFKHGKNATETYGMLQTAFRPSCINRAWVFEWHKRFKEGRESVRDYERCGRSKNQVNGISIRTMHQSTTPSLSQTIWPRWALRQFLTLTLVETLLPVTFAYSLNLQAVVIRYWGDERGCEEGHWHAHTRGLQWDLPEVVGTVQEVHCNRRRLLRRGLEFYVCTINKSAHTKNIWKCLYLTGFNRWVK